MADMLDPEARERLRDAFLQANASISLEGAAPEADVLKLQQQVIDGTLSIDDAIRRLTLDAQRN